MGVSVCLNTTSNPILVIPNYKAKDRQKILYSDAHLINWGGP